MNSSLLREVEVFLKKDLSNQKLSSKTNRRKNELLSRVTLEITRLENDGEKDFIAQQREKARSQSINSERASLPLPSIPSESDIFEEAEMESNYMDLDDFVEDNSKSPKHLSLPRNDQHLSDGGSGSGYESYASDDDSSKRNCHEELETLFATFNCSVFSYIHLETSKKFQKGKKWAKRVGVIEDHHFKCYKKAGDIGTVLDILLRGYCAIVENDEQSKGMLVTLETSDTGDSTYRFVVEREVADKWSKALRESANSFMQKGILHPPPVAHRPIHTLASDGRSVSQSSMGRQGSLHDYCTSDDVSIVISDVTSSSGSSTNSITTPTPTGNSYLGKGIRSVTNVFWKDNKDKNVKKRMATAERLGAKLSGYLGIFSADRWFRKWCVVNHKQLMVYGKEEAAEMTIDLPGCDLMPVTEDTEHKFTFKLMKKKKELVKLEANSSDEMGRWVGILIAETGCAEPPSPSTYAGYMEPTMIESLVKASRTSFNIAKGRKENNDDEVYMDLNERDSDPLKKLKNPPNFSPSANKRPIKKTQESIKSSSKNSNDISNQNKAATLPKTSSKVDGSKKRAPLPPPSEKKSEAKKDDRKNESNGKYNKEKTIKKNEIKRVDESKKSENENESDEIKQLRKKKDEIAKSISRIDKKLEELQKYIDAAESAKEKIPIRRAVRETKEKREKLEQEELDVGGEIRRLTRAANKIVDGNNNSNGDDAHCRVSMRHSVPSGNVSAKLKMFEVAK